MTTYYICNRCSLIQRDSHQCRGCGWGDMYPMKPEPDDPVDRVYGADFPAGTRWYDYVLSGALVAVLYPIALVGRLLKKRPQKK